MLAADLSKDHVNIAIRHFLMLQASGVPVPMAIAKRCMELLHMCHRCVFGELRRTSSVGYRRWASVVSST